MTFNAEKHLIELQGKAYLEVKWRLVWFRQECPNGTIDTEEVIVDLDREVEAEVPTGNWIPNPNRPGKKMPEKIVKRDKGYARFRAVVTDGKGGRATASKSENAASFPDFIEKAETGAVGRALAMLGYGTQFTGDELNEEHRIVDAPVERSSSFQYAGNGGSGNGRSAAASVTSANGQQSDEKAASAPATEQQLASLRKLYQHLGKPMPEDQGVLSYRSAKELILSLSKEFNESRQGRKAS
jgi:hypothetical protein